MGKWEGVKNWKRAFLFSSSSLLRSKFIVSSDKRLQQRLQSLPFILVDTQIRQAVRLFQFIS